MSAAFSSPLRLTLATFFALALIAAVAGIAGGAYLLDRVRADYLDTLAESNARLAERTSAMLSRRLARSDDHDAVRADFQSRLAAAPIDDQGFLCLLDHETRVVSHPRTEMIGMSMARAPTREIGNDQTGPLIERKQQRRAFLMETADFPGNDPHLVYQEPVPRSTWRVSVHTNLARLEERVAAIRWALIGTGIPILSLFTLLGTAAVRAVARRYEGHLEAVNSDLEARVNERTAELASAKTAAESADHLKGQFLMVMRHEHRTPLNALIGYTELLQSDPDDADRDEYLRGIRGAADHLDQVLSRVLQFAEIESGRIQPRHDTFPLAALCHRWTQRYRPEASARGLGFSCRTDPADAMWEGDIDGIATLGAELIDNAVKFTAAGNVEVTLERVAERAHPPFLRLRVADTGCGLPAGMEEQIFELFRQGDEGVARAHDGLGLGLAMVRRLADLLGGHLAFASEPDVGTCFRVDLPATSTVCSAQARAGLPARTQARDLAPVGSARELMAEALRT